MTRSRAGNSPRFTTRLNSRLMTATAATFALVVALAAPAAWADLLPHRAVYTLSIGSGAVTGGDGVMSYEIKDVCDGWAVDLKAELAFASEDGQVHRFGWSQVTWEAKDGSRYRYFMRELTDSEETSRRRGEARRPAPGAVAKVVADLPEQSEFTLPKDTVFPLEHTAALIAADAKGSPYVLAQLFDGSVGDHAIEVGAALGPGTSDWFGPVKVAPDLAGQRSFPVALAYFITQSPEGMPDTEQRLRMYANGVVGQLVFALGDMEIQARLDEFKTLKPEPC